MSAQEPAGPEAPSEPPAASDAPRGWKAGFTRFTERFGHLMSRILLTVMYACLVGPAGVILSTLGDRLAIRRWSGSSWKPWPYTNETLDQARRQG